MAGSGGPGTRLVVLRGNSGSGKSTVASALRSRLGPGTAWVEQDHLRRVILQEKDIPGGRNIGLIEHTVRYLLDSGCNVLLEGILTAERYEPMLLTLAEAHRGQTIHYYFDLTLEETLGRHATRPLAGEVGAEQLRSWYRNRDLRSYVTEHVISGASALDDTVHRILTDLQDTMPAP